MNNRITKQRLKTFFTYETVKVVAVLAIVLVVLTIIFNAFSNAPTPAQTYSILIDTRSVVIGEGDYDFYQKAKNGSKNRYGISYDILSFTNPRAFDTETQASESLISTYHDVHDDDIFIGGKELTQFYLERGYAQEINAYVRSLENFLFVENGFYDSALTPTEDINETAVENYFIKVRGKDSRFKKQKNRQEGIANEIERIKGLKTNLELFKKVIEICPELIATQDEFAFKLGGYEMKGNYVFDLGVLGEGFINVYKTKVTTETESYYTTKGIYLTIGEHEELSGDLYFETLAFILTLVEDYSNILDGYL